MDNMYARHLGADQEKLYRALLVSDLVTIHQKSGIGRLSAYCGAVSAGVGMVLSTPLVTMPSPLLNSWRFLYIE